MKGRATSAITKINASVRRGSVTAPVKSPTDRIRSNVNHPDYDQAFGCLEDFLGPTNKQKQEAKKKSGK